MSDGWRWLRWAWTVIALALLAWFGMRAWSVVAASPEAALREAPWRLVAAFACFVAHVALAIAAWASLLRPWMPADTGWREAVRLFVLPLPAKYVPGSVWQLLGRGHLMTQAGYSRDVAVAAVLAEQVIIVLSASMLALVGLLALGMNGASARTGATISLVLAGVGGALAVLGLFARVLRPRLAALREGGRWSRLVGPAFALTVASHVMFLAGYVACVGTWLDPSPHGVLGFATVVMAATVAGLLTPIAPGGIGVREAGIVLLSGPAALLHPVPVAVAVATVAAALSRLMLIVLELVAFVTVRWLERKRA